MLKILAAAVALQVIQLPAPRGYVNDFANVLPAESEERIQRIVDEVRAKSGGEVVVVTLADVGRYDVADVARELGRRWKVGRRGRPGDPARNAGVVVLIVPKETSSDGRGHFRIETGMGAEGFLPDGVTGRIQDEALPLLVRGNYGRALELTVLRVAQRFAREFDFSLDSPAAAAPSERAPPERAPAQAPAGGTLPFGLLLIAFIFLLLLLSYWLRAPRYARGRRRGCGCLPLFVPIPVGGYSRGGGFGRGGSDVWRGDRGWGGGGFGGGDFGGFGGGGGFAGGGSSRSW